MVSELRQQVNHWVWQQEPAAVPWWQQELIRFARIAMLTGRDLSQGMLTLRAMSLVYTTLLSFVPLLAVSFSVLKGFGVHNQIEPLLLNFLSPLGDKSDEMTRNIVGFVENMRIGVLGALGLGLLMYTVISLIQKIEAALNFTWRLDSTRNLAQRFSNYLSVIMVGPVLIFSAVGITASLKSHTIVTYIEKLPYSGELIQLLGNLVPYALIIGAFTFVYMLVPNTRVRLKSALYGAFIAGILWRLTGALFASFASGSTSYTAIYSGFAIPLLFMIWLYLGWLILLIGASISFYHQHPERLRWREESDHMSAQLRENLALQLMLEIGRQHDRGEPSRDNAERLAARLQVPQGLVERMLKVLRAAGMLLEVSEDADCFVPAMSLDRIRLSDIVDLARQADDQGLVEQMRTDTVVSNMQRDLSACRQQVLGDSTLKDLIDPVNNDK